MPAIPLTKTHVHAGDIVKVISGNHRGSEGKILQVNRAKHQVLVEGVRMIKKHVRRSQDQPNGAIIEREGPINISNVKLLQKGVREAAAKEASKPKVEKKPAASKKKSEKAEKGE